jgi:hypothetical protein
MAALRAGRTTCFVLCRWILTRAHQVLSVVVNGQKIIDRLEGNLAKQYSIALLPRYRSIDD